MAILLTGSDGENDPLSFAVVSGPSHGTLTGTPPSLTYTPALNYFGTDTFTFTVSDGQATSAPATVSLAITPVNDAPTATDRSLPTEVNTALMTDLWGSDADRDTLSFAVVSGPSHGTLTGTPPHFTYTPAAYYSGPDSFQYTVSDGQATSAPATISLTVASPYNHAPVALAQSILVAAGNPTAIALDVSDADGDALTFTIVSSPDTGTITGEPPNIHYTAPASFTGTTRFTYSVSDGKAISSAEVQLTVEKRSLTVSAAVDTLRPRRGQPVRFYANAVDEAGADIALQWDFGDGQTSAEQLPVHTFAAPGTYAVRLKASTATEEATTVLRMHVSTSDDIRLDYTEPPVNVGEGEPVSLRVEANPFFFGDSWSLGGGGSGYGLSGVFVWMDDVTFTVTVTRWPFNGGLPLESHRTIIVHNMPPVPLPQEKLSVEVGQPVSLQLSGSDAAGANDPLSWELIRGDGSLTPTGLFTWTPSQAGLATIITKVSDGDGGESRLAFQISVSDPSLPTPPPSPPPAPPLPPEGGKNSGCGTSSRGASGALTLGLLFLSLAYSGRKSRS